MMTQSKQPHSSTTPEHHHGDLRKGAYLRRRAAYQMQAAGESRPQAGMTTKAKTGA